MQVFSYFSLALAGLKVFKVDLGEGGFKKLKVEGIAFELRKSLLEEDTDVFYQVANSEVLKHFVAEVEDNVDNWGKGWGLLCCSDISEDWPSASGFWLGI